MPQVIFRDLGLIDYKSAWDYQEKLFNEIISIKLANRQLSAAEEESTPHYLLFCEHPHVYTLGKSGSMKHLRANYNTLLEKQVSFFKTNRGGDITYHGPGQVVGYPILDLDNFFTDIHKYLRFLEEIIIRTLRDYGIKGGRVEGATGVWIDGDIPHEARKICAMGVRCSRWVTMHGFAFNVNTDLDFYNHIDPCGITDKSVTSIKKELGKEINIEQVKEKLKKYFAEVFEAEIIITP